MIKIMLKGGKDSILFGTDNDQENIKQLTKAWSEGKAISFTIAEGDIVKATVLCSEIAAIVLAPSQEKPIAGLSGEDAKDFLKPYLSQSDSVS